MRLVRLYRVCTPLRCTSLVSIHLLMLASQRAWVTLLLYSLAATAKTELARNQAVLVSASRFWFNYRHTANALAMHNHCRRYLSCLQSGADGSRATAWDLLPQGHCNSCA